MAQIYRRLRECFTLLRRHHVRPNALLQLVVPLGNGGDADQHHLDLALIVDLERPRPR